MEVLLLGERGAAGESSSAARSQGLLGNYPNLGEEVVDYLGRSVQK